MTQEFRISVTPASELDDSKETGDKYLVRTELSAPGVRLAEEKVSWPIERWLATARQLMNDPLLNWLEGDTVIDTNTPDMVALGQELYHALFQGTLRESWMMAQAIAQNRREVLQLRIALKGKLLPNLPWEILHAGDRPLATGTDVTFSRYQPGTVFIQPIKKIKPHQPLRILMTISAPNDQANLQLKEEALQLQQELENRWQTPLQGKNSASWPGKAGLDIELTILEQPDREQLTQALEQGNYHIFHYAGHSGLGATGGELYLVSGKTGLSEKLSGDDLAGLLVNNGIQMAVLNSCRGAFNGNSHSYQNEEINYQDSLAETLVRRGIPSVLAMAERIPDQVSLTLTRLFYRNLIQGYSVDLSLSRARQGLISAYGSHQLYWSLPVLYLHPEFDGKLIDTTPVKKAEIAKGSVVNSNLTSVVNKNGPTLISATTLHNGDQTWLTDDPDLDWADDLENVEFLDELEGNLHHSEAIEVEAFLTTKDHKNLAVADQLPKHKSVPLPPPIPASTGLSKIAKNKSKLFFNQSHRPSIAANETPNRDKKLWHKLGSICGTIALLGSIGLGSFCLGRDRGLQPNELLPAIALPTSISQKFPPIATPVNLERINTKELVSIAISHFQQGDFLAGEAAVNALLDDNRSALQSAKQVLDTIPAAQANDPAISFLKGRIAWQFSQQGNQNYNISDARLYWFSAVQGSPDVLTYRNALAFAYYEEGKLDLARQTWLEIINVSDPDHNDIEMLNAYAGLGMMMMRMAQNQPPKVQQELRKKAIALRQIVLNEDPLNFQLNALAQDWLWTEKALQDWRSLLKLVVN